MKLSKRLSIIPSSPILTICSKALALKESGQDIIGLSAGEPDFNTPKLIQEAATRAMANGETHYTAVSGSPQLKQAISDYYQRKFGIIYQPDEIIASNGAKHSLYNLFLALLNPGDEVIIPTPYWVTYPTQVRVARGKPVFVKGEVSNHFLPTIEQLNKAVTERTKVIIINNPTNPTGAFWTRDELRVIADWLLEHPQIAVISDAIYDELVYDDLEYEEIIHIEPSLQDRYFIINGVSKAFAMTGWRLGYTLGPAQIIKGMNAIQSQSTSNPSSVTQAATVAALNNSEILIKPFKKQFAKRRDLIFSLLSEIKGIVLEKPRGAFYVFPNIEHFIGKKTNDYFIKDDIALVFYLLETVGLATVPGSMFGAPGFLRISYARNEETIRFGIKRLEKALNALR